MLLLLEKMLKNVDFLFLSKNFEILINVDIKI